MGIYGTLEGFAETGTEGVIWSLIKDDKPSYDSLEFIEQGDYLQIFNEDGSILWEGTIDYDYSVGYEPYPLNPSCGGQVSMGFYVHGIQIGFSPDDWGKLFFYWKEGDIVQTIHPPKKACLYKQVDYPRQHWAIKAGFTGEDLRKILEGEK